ncbi:hypothetical protein SteCoe_12560 [Stentor coeruleus]|uniref:Cyclic nucleotide-binding domain-containing protein n=1 Tax=Stentor coeruleus TaxID=5963 RepID=A0A1R2CAH0_9CILI|nr:hypothetical protein SteCoe_12560 [Stentor coeruleus]
MNDNTLINKVRQICKKKPNERSNIDIQDLQDLTKHSKIFQSLNETNGENAHLICCRYLLYEFCHAGNYLFQVGDLGTRFYIIIKGKVGVEIPIKDENTGEIKHLEVVQISKGGCFGELALESSKPRAASIKCKIDSHFVYLEKVDYNRMIAKLVQDKRNEMVKFLQSLPAFSNMTKTTLGKLTYNFKEKDFSKGQIVYKEGEIPVDVYLVIEGEFLFQKKILVEDGRRKKFLYNEAYSEHAEVLRFRTKGLIKKLVQIGDICKLGIGELFGVEELDDEPRRSTCICNSTKAKVLCISRSDFFKRIRGEEVFEYLQKKSNFKAQELESRASVWRFIAEDKAASLSPIQMRKREKCYLQNIESSRKHSPLLEKSSTTHMFSRRVELFHSNFLRKLVEIELNKKGSTLVSRHKNWHTPSEKVYSNRDLNSQY